MGHPNPKLAEFNRSNKGRPKPQWWKDLMKEKMKGKNSDSMKRLWQDEAYAKNWSEKCGMKPNRLEKSFMEFLKAEGLLNWRYVGNGKVWIGGKNPDFIHRNADKILELFGSYWHKPEEAEERISHFEKFGYECIVVWDHEFKDWKHGLGYI